MRNDWLNRSTLDLILGTSPGDMAKRFSGVFVDVNGAPASNAEWLYDPDLAAVAGFPAKYWIITGDLVTLMDQTARDVVDAAAVTSRNDTLANLLAVDDPEVIQAFAEVVLDEINVLRSQHSLNARTLAQLKTAVRGKL